MRAAEELGVTYVEARAQQMNYKQITINNRVLMEFLKNLSAGLGIRMLYDGRFSFSSTNGLNRDSILEAIEKAVSAASF